MSRQFKVITNSDQNESRTYTVLSPEEKMKHFQNVIASILQSAQNNWADIWNEFQGTVTRGIAVSPEAEKGLFKPQCGWPELLEKMCLLKHYLDYAKSYCEGKK